MNAARLTPLERAISAARIVATSVDVRELAACHTTTLQKLLNAALKHLDGNSRARCFDYDGMRFRLHRFGGWLIVLNWRGQPVAGPIRVRQGAAS